jgi:hypothetical protein
VTSPFHHEKRRRFSAKERAEFVLCTDIETLKKEASAA